MINTRKESQKRLFRSSISFISLIKVDNNYELAIINKYLNDCSPKSLICGIYSSGGVENEILKLYAQDTVFCIRDSNEHKEMNGILKQQFKQTTFYTTHRLIKELFPDNKTRKEAQMLFDDMIRHYFVNPSPNQSNVDGKNAQQRCESFSDCLQYVLQKKGYEINNSYIISGCQYVEQKYNYKDMFLMCKIVYAPTIQTHYFHLDKVQFNEEKNLIEIKPSYGRDTDNYHVAGKIREDERKELIEHFKSKMEKIKGIIYCSEETKGIVQQIFVEKDLVLKSIDEYFDLILHGYGKYCKYCKVSDIQKVKTELTGETSSIGACVKELNDVLKKPREYREICLFPTVPKRQKDYPLEKSDWNHFIFCYHEEEQMIDSTTTFTQK